MNPAHTQRDFGIRFEWGLAGGSAVAAGADIAVVVDVLSFTTTLSVALDRGVEVFPYRWNDDGAAAYAIERGATLAVGRRAAGPGAVSLSPGTIRAAPGLERLVLPSPNGSSIACELGATATMCVAASLRNAGAVARWIGLHHPGAVVAIVAGGEKWPDGALRPAVEDLWGAGAVIAGLPAPGPLSPEAQVAADAWTAVQARMIDALRDCASGRELIEAGYADDVAVAAEVGQSTCVPVLRDQRFVDATAA
ncbi:2-phosphosulfolactate phosphatase [Rhodococcus phenolicus]|uniref:2-phosphosulfolactate phosphatase n=1 Tax=Rhodococcus phenolicus TaxID=263849 RepID=UPI00082BDA95|nr:2-phosphosulfolactate phosphatase [Rhodococcus phenolicus]